MPEVVPGSGVSIAGAITNTRNPAEEGRTQRFLKDVKQEKDLCQNHVSNEQNKSTIVKMDMGNKRS